MGDGDAAGGAIERIFREESGRIIATLIRLVRNFDLAEDALQDAIGSAIVAWRRDGIPANPAAWLTTAARRKAIDRLRRDRARGSKRDTHDALARLEAAPPYEAPVMHDVDDDRLRLIFTCCHPALRARRRWR
jgi:RNA polymerase sigma-70 factor (ECF subfamily)